MLNKYPFFGKLSGHQIQYAIVFVLALIAVAWRYTPLMPHVFYGDDLNYLLAFKDEQCGTVASQLLTTVCADKFRPLAAGFVLLLFNMFDSAISHYMAVNMLLQATSATLVFGIAYRLSKGSLVAALSLTLAVATSRFAAYQVTQVIGPVEGLALPLFLFVVYSILRADENKGEALRWGWFAILLSFLLIHNHERYIVIAAWLGVIFILLPNFRALPKKHLIALLGACVALPIFYVTYKIAILHTPFFIGTGGKHLSFDFGRVLAHAKMAVLSVVGFNEGPEYLVGVRLASLPWYPAWFLAATLVTIAAVSIGVGVRGAIFNKMSGNWQAVLQLVLLGVLAGLLLIPAISTIRLEQRWLFAPFILMMFAVAWAVGQQRGKLKVLMTLLIVILAATSILLDSIFIKQFDEIFFISSARFAEIVKRDIADEFPGQSSDIDLLTNPDHCGWVLQSGGFFRIYGGKERKVNCVSLRDVQVEAQNAPRTSRVFAESTPGKLSDITESWRTQVESRRGKVLYDFINAYPSGQINSLDKVDTPNGRGVLILPVMTLFGSDKALTVISGFSYRFNDVVVAKGAELRFGLSMIYPSEPVRANVYVAEKRGGGEKVIFSQVINPPRASDRLEFIPISISLSEYSGRNLDLIFSAEPMGSYANGQWLGFSSPQIVMPKRD